MMCDKNFFLKNAISFFYFPTEFKTVFTDLRDSFFSTRYNFLKNYRTLELKIYVKQKN